jgi:gamma-glutamyltranspeptidase/glutathione hydrolase/leukotriene-C4 hydrolase
MERLANTLSVIAESERGAYELYDGSLTEDFVKDIAELGGIITREDMASYKAAWMSPIEVKLRDGLVAYTMPPPGSGYILSFALKLMDKAFIPTPWPHLNPSNYIKMTEAFKHAYGLRSHLGDSNFVDITRVTTSASYTYL